MVSACLSEYQSAVCLCVCRFVHGWVSACGCQSVVGERGCMFVQEWVVGGWWVADVLGMCVCLCRYVQLYSGAC